MLQLNELDQVRAAVLRNLFPECSVTTFNAAQINQHISVRPTVVIMNPPFARNAAGAEDPFAAHRHFVAALASLQHGGRIVAIMPDSRSEEHTSELQSLMRISYAVFCLKKKTKHNT